MTFARSAPTAKYHIVGSETGLFAAAVRVLVQHVWIQVDAIWKDDRSRFGIDSNLGKHAGIVERFEDLSPAHDRGGQNTGEDRGPGNTYESRSRETGDPAPARCPGTAGLQWLELLQHGLGESHVPTA